MTTTASAIFAVTRQLERADMLARRAVCAFNDDQNHTARALCQSLAEAISGLHATLLLDCAPTPRVQEAAVRLQGMAAIARDCGHTLPGADAHPNAQAAIPSAVVRILSAAISVLCLAVTHTQRWGDLTLPAGTLDGVRALLGCYLA